MPSFYYTTTKTKSEAESIVQYLLANKLIAGANMFPIESKYWWQEGYRGDFICKENEYAVFMQAMEKNFSKIEEAVKQIHSYKTPCIIRLDINEGNTEFLEWVKYYSEEKQVQDAQSLAERAKQKPRFLQARASVKQDV